MKKILLIVAFIFTSLLNSASISENGENLFSEDFVEQTSDNFYQINDAIYMLKDCTVRLDFELQ